MGPWAHRLRATGLRLDQPVVAFLSFCPARPQPVFRFASSICSSPGFWLGGGFSPPEAWLVSVFYSPGRRDRPN